MHEITLIVDAQSRAVSGQAGFHHGRHRPGQIAPKAGSAHQNNFGFMFVDKMTNGLVVRLSTIMAINRGIEKINLLRPITESFGTKVFDTAADNYRRKFHIELRRQFGPGAEQLPGNFRSFLV